MFETGVDLIILNLNSNNNMDSNLTFQLREHYIVDKPTCQIEHRKPLTERKPIPSYLQRALTRRSR